jgi:hypothetical protein
MAEFECECIGAKKFHALMKLCNDKIDITPHDLPPEYILSIPYKSITEIQVLTSKQASSFLAIGDDTGTLMATAGISILTNMLINKPKTFLALTFNDAEAPFTVGFKIKKAEEVYNAISEKIAQAAERSSIYGGKLKLCPHGHENSPSAKECWICGAHLTV